MRIEEAYGWAKTLAGLRKRVIAGCPRSNGSPCLSILRKPEATTPARQAVGRGTWTRWVWMGSQCSCGGAAHTQQRRCPSTVQAQRSHLHCPMLGPKGPGHGQVRGRKATADRVSMGSPYRTSFHAVKPETCPRGDLHVTGLLRAQRAGGTNFQSVSLIHGHFASRSLETCVKYRPFLWHAICVLIDAMVACQYRGPRSFSGDLP